MSFSLSKFNIKNFLLVSILLFATFFATSVQAATTKSEAYLKNQNVNAGKTINVHGGSAWFSSFNESRSTEWLYGSIKQSILLLPDPARYTNIDEPGRGIGTTVSLKPSTYYAYATSPRHIYGYVKITGNQ